MRSRSPVLNVSDVAIALIEYHNCCMSAQRSSVRGHGDGGLWHDGWHGMGGGGSHEDVGEEACLHGDDMEATTACWVAALRAAVPVRKRRPHGARM
jgi:hypothetical protein